MHSNFIPTQIYLVSPFCQKEELFAARCIHVQHGAYMCSMAFDAIEEHLPSMQVFLARITNTFLLSLKLTSFPKGFALCSWSN